MRFLSASVLLVTLAWAPAHAQPLPMDPAYTVGTLDNGLTYLIRPNHRPENRASLWLVVNTGSILEDDDQRGLAHFLEHMAFNGTRDFEKQELVDYLESVGMRFGPDLNATTSFDETIYMLEVPTDSAAIMDKALLIMENWATGISLEPEEIEKERGVVLEELRAGRGAGARIRDQQFPVLLHDSKYADRLPIGLAEVIETAPAEAFQRFYHDWYRPDLMAVVAVGDFDPAAVESAIVERFSAIPARRDTRPRAMSPVPGHEETLVSIATDPEYTSTDLTIYHKVPPRVFTTEEENRETFAEGVYHGMLNTRFNEIRQRPGAPFLFAGSGAGALVRTSGVQIHSARLVPGKVLEGLRAMLTEVERVKRFGFTESEFERAKTNMLRSLEMILAEKDNNPSRSHAAAAANHFLTGSALPGIEKNVDLARRDIPTLTLDEINAFAQQANQGSRVITVSAPEKDAENLPTQDQLMAVYEELLADQSIAAWEDNVREEPLVETKPRLSIVVKEDVIQELDVTEWTLRNGVRVIIKPTDFRNDQVLLTGFSPGGTSLVDDGDYHSAELSTSVLSAGGLGEFDPIELGKALTGKIASASVDVGELEETVSGQASPKDLETMLQLVYLKFTAPRLDTTLARSLMDRFAAQLDNAGASPLSVFGDEQGRVWNQDHPRRRAYRAEDLDEVDFQRSLEIYQDRFADASDFTFVLVGSLDPDTVKPLVMTWLGGLPSTNREETWRDVGVRHPDGAIQINVWKGVEEQSRVDIDYHGSGEWDPLESHALRSLAEALRITLREELREEMGGVYGVGVSSAWGSRPIARYTFSISFGCAPENVETLQAAVFAEIERARKEGFPPDVITKVREAQRRARETSLEENGYWLNLLASYYRDGRDPRGILEFDRLVESVTSERLQAAAQNLLHDNRRLVARLFPE